MDLKDSCAAICGGAQPGTRPMLDPRMDLFAVLNKHGVPFVVIGGHAVIAHGFIRGTEDHDIVFVRSPDAEQRLHQALVEIHARWISNERDPKTRMEITIPVSLNYVQGTRMMMLLTDLGFLDIFDYIPGHPESPVQDLVRDAISIEGVPYASREWLLRMKRAAGRPKDRVDIENLEDDPA
jgi:hypothetical protein